LRGLLLRGGKGREERGGAERRETRYKGSKGRKREQRERAGA